MRNALEQIALVEERRRQADEVPRDERRVERKARNLGLGIERNAVGAAIELFFGVDLEIGGRQGEIEVAGRGRTPAHFDSMG